MSLLSQANSTDWKRGLAVQTLSLSCRTDRAFSYTSRAMRNIAGVWLLAKASIKWLLAFRANLALTSRQRLHGQSAD
jgi:hypothetical protein